MNETTDATAIFAPIWRRKWLILAVGIVVAAASYLYYKHQRHTYQVSTQVFLGAAGEEQGPTEKGTKARGSTLANQAAVINTIVVEQVRRRLRETNSGKLARETKVKAKAPEKSEFIMISAEGHSARGVALAANLTAQAYIRRSTDNHQRAIQKAIAIDRRQLRRIELSAVAKEQPTKKKGGAKSSGSGGAGSSSSPSASSVIQEANLSSKINQLESSLGTITAQQVKPAKASTATLVSPKPRKDAIFGFVIGLVLAAIAAYAVSRLDRRLRAISSIEAVTQLALLTAMPKVRRPIVRDGQSSRPSAHLLEPLRRLQAALQLSDTPGGASSTGRPPRIILFVSPDPGDGKSTTAADLALVQRDGGARVVVVEANFRRPTMNRLLGVEGDGRLASVLNGRLDIEEAAQRVAPAISSEAPHEDLGGHGTATAVQARVGSLFVLGGDRTTPNPPALLAQESVGDLLHSLAARFDYVLVDVPSPLEVSDAMPLLSIVDRIIVVARVGHTREASAQRLRQLLAGQSCAPVAGVVANFVAPAELKRYGFSRARASIWPGSRT